MKMSKQKEFLKELKALLKKYDAEITAAGHCEDSASVVDGIRITVEFKDCKIEDIESASYIDQS